MLHLLHVLAIGQLLRAPARALMTLAGCALGVCLVFASDLVSASVSTSFRRSVEVLAGRAAWVVGESGGVDEALLEQLHTVEGVHSALPMIRELVRDASAGANLSVGDRPAQQRACRRRATPPTPSASSTIPPLRRPGRVHAAYALAGRGEPVRGPAGTVRGRRARRTSTSSIATTRVCAARP